MRIYKKILLAVLVGTIFGVFLVVVWQAFRDDNSEQFVLDRRIAIIDSPVVISPGATYAGRIYHFPDHDDVTLYVTPKTLDGGRLKPSDTVGVRVFIMVSHLADKFGDPANADGWHEHSNFLIDTDLEKMYSAPHDYAAMRLEYRNESEVDLSVLSFVKITSISKKEQAK